MQCQCFNVCKIQNYPEGSALSFGLRILEVTSASFWGIARIFQVEEKNLQEETCVGSSYRLSQLSISQNSVLTIVLAGMLGVQAAKRAFGRVQGYCVTPIGGQREGQGWVLNAGSYWTLQWRCWCWGAVKAGSWNLKVTSSFSVTSVNLGRKINKKGSEETPDFRWKLRKHDQDWEKPGLMEVMHPIPFVLP